MITTIQKAKELLRLHPWDTDQNAAYFDYVYSQVRQNALILEDANCGHREALLSLIGTAHHLYEHATEGRVELACESLWEAASAAFADSF